MIYIIPDLVKGNRVRFILKQKNQFAKGETIKFFEKTSLFKRKVELKWVIIKEKTRWKWLSTYKTKSFWKKEKIWTTLKKKKEKARIEEIKKCNIKV